MSGVDQETALAAQSSGSSLARLRQQNCAALAAGPGIGFWVGGERVCHEGDGDEGEERWSDPNVQQFLRISAQVLRRKHLHSQPSPERTDR